MAASDGSLLLGSHSDLRHWFRDGSDLRRYRGVIQRRWLACFSRPVGFVLSSSQNPTGGRESCASLAEDSFVAGNSDHVAPDVFSCK